MRNVNALQLVEGLTVEELGSDFVVMIPGGQEVITLTGDAATTFRGVRNGAAVNPEDPVVADLEQLGIIRPYTPINRRGVIKAAGVGLGTGIAVLAMPSVAAASSDGPQDLTGGFAVDFVDSSGGGTNPITEIRMGISRDGSTQLADLGLSDGDPGVVTLANGTVINVSFNAGQRRFDSGTINIAEADFKGITHILEFTIGADNFLVEFVQD